MKKDEDKLSSLQEENSRLQSQVATMMNTIHSFDVTLRSIGDGIICTDVNRKITLINKVAQELTGWKEEDAIGRNLLEVFNIINETTREPAEDPVEQVLKSGHVEGLANHTLLIRADGTEISIADSAAPIKDEEDNLMGVVLVFRDQTDQREAEILLQQEHNQILALFDGIDDVIYVADPETYELLHVNAIARKYWGEDIIGKKCYKILQNLDAPCPFCTNDKILGEYFGKSYVWEFQNMVTKNWYRCSDKAIRWIDGRYVRFELASDITELKNTELALLKSEAFNNALIGSIPMKMFMKDPDLNYLMADKKYARDCGLEPEDIVGKTDFEFYSKELAERYRADDREVLEKGKVKDIEEPYVIDGKEYWIHTIKSQVKNSDGDLIGVLGLFEDITQRKKLESDLFQTLKALKTSNLELEQFAYVASHDLQEPLRMVSSYTQLLEKRYKDQLDQDAKDFINYAVDGANRMQRLIQDLLSFSRVTTRGREFEPLDAHEPLGEAVYNLQSAIQDSGAMVINDDLPIIRGDYSQIVMVFQNLIGNAIRYQKNDTAPRIHIHAEKYAKDPGFVEFTVSDNGIGIEDKYFERIFVIFQRLHGRQEYPGTGLGLALCKRIIERHKGKIWVESEPGKGSTFHFTLPSE